MRLKLLTNLNTLLLISVCLALGATLWWSQQALERPYQLMARYLSLSQSFQQDVAQNIHDYLASVDHDLGALRAARDAGDLEAVTREAHKLKGAARLVGAQDLATAAGVLEDAARNGAWAEARVLAAHVETAVQHLRLFVRERYPD